MALLTVRLVGPRSRGAGNVLNGAYEANSQTFKAGSLVYVNATSGVTVCSNQFGAGTAITCAGIALVDATNVSSGNIEIPIALIHAGDEIEMYCYDTNAAAAKSAANFEPGEACEHYTTGGYSYADGYGSTYANLIFVRPVVTRPSATSYRGVFVIPPDYLQFG